MIHIFIFLYVHISYYFKYYIILYLQIHIIQWLSHVFKHLTWVPWGLGVVETLAVCQEKHPQSSLSFVRAGDALPPRKLWRAHRWNDDRSPSRPCGAGLWFYSGARKPAAQTLAEYTTVHWFPSGTLHDVSFLVPYVVFQPLPRLVDWRVFCWDVTRSCAGCSPLLAGTARARRCGRRVAAAWICRYNTVDGSMVPWILDEHIIWSVHLSFVIVFSP